NLQTMKSVKMQKNLVLSALFAAFICAGCFIQVPLPGGVPIAIQDMMAMLAGLLLGPVFGGLAVLVFLLLGAAGLPVFTGKAGIHVLFAGPTSGFLWGYLLAAVLAGTILALFGKVERNQAQDENGGKTENAAQNSTVGKTKNAAQWLVITLAALAATIVLFVLGIAIGMRIINVGLEKALAIFLIPFIPGNVIKLVLMVVLTKKLRPAILAYTE
ncbi:MAG: biotin transporter BioY, partial [Treponema sp.]|nr:biotin transporter BioY [Treponema sp.]